MTEEKCLTAKNVKSLYDQDSSESENEFKLQVNPILIFGVET